MTFSKLPQRSKKAATKRMPNSGVPIAPKSENGAKFFGHQDARQKSERQHVLALTDTPGALAAALTEVSKAFDTVGSEFRKNRNKILARAYEIAFVLRENSDTWRDFCRLPDWQDVRRKPHIDHPDQALEHTLRLIHGLRDHSGQKKASTVNTALSRLWDARTLPGEIETAIEKGNGTTSMAT